MKDCSYRRCEFVAQFNNIYAHIMYTGPLLPKAVGDANANAMDKALDALNSWLAKANESQAARCDWYSQENDLKIGDHNLTRMIAGLPRVCALPWQKSV